MKNPSMKNFLWEMYNNNKTKSKKFMILCMQKITHKNLLVCVCVCVQLVAHISGNSKIYDC